MDRGIADNGALIDQYRVLIERALRYGNGTHSFADVRELCRGGDACFWDGPNSCIVTEIVTSPGKRFLNFFLAAGRMAELEAMTPLILEWGKSQGCTHAMMTGRKGWASKKLFLAKTGWTEQKYVILEKEL